MIKSIIINKCNLSINIRIHKLINTALRQSGILIVGVKSSNERRMKTECFFAGQVSANKVRFRGHS